MLGLGEMELISPITPPTVLCFVLVAAKVLRIDTSVLATAQQCSHIIKSIQQTAPSLSNFF